jgi:hypothetical protein
LMTIKFDAIYSRSIQQETRILASEDLSPVHAHALALKSFHSEDSKECCRNTSEKCALANGDT